MPVARIGQERIVNSTTTEDQHETTVAALDNGRFVVTWYTEDAGDGDGLGIRARLFNANGTPVAADFIVNSTGSGTQYDAHVDGLPDGRFMVAWVSRASGGENYIRARVFGPDGTPVAVDFQVNAATFGSRYSPAVTAIGEDRFLVTWDAANGDGSSYAVKGRLYNADGTSIGSEFTVNTTTTDSQSSALAAELSDGRFIVVFNSDDPADGDDQCIRARIFDEDGTPAGNDFIVNTTGAGAQFFAEVIQLGDGRLVIAWHSYDSGDGSGATVRARFFNTDGAPQGDDFIVNTTTQGSQSRVSLTALDDGRFVAVWESNDPGDGSSSCIRARVFGVDGKPAGDDFIVNTTAEASQQEPVVEALPGGKFVVSWLSYDTGDGSGTVIRSQMFNARQFNGSDSADTWSGGNAVDVITGGAENDTLSGFGDHDRIDGGSGADLIDGGLGKDTLNGGDGTDDWVSYASATGAITFNLAITTGQNTGNAGTDTATNFENVRGGSGNDTLTGTTASNVIEGGLGNDSLSGGAGAGRDTASYETSTAAVTVNLAITTQQNTIGAGRDTLIGFENLTGGFGADTLAGNAGANAINGGDGNDTITGGGGADTLAGGAGDDTYVNPHGDTIIEAAGAGGGTDLVRSSLSFAMGDLANVENLTLVGTGAINGGGNALANHIIGNDAANTLSGLEGNDTLEGAGGSDLLRGGTGDDTYINPVLAGPAADTIEELAGAGIDTVRSNTTFLLSTLAQVERLELTGSAAIDGTGNGRNNTIIGNDGANILSGGSGNDTLSGGGGKDQLIGGQGNDTMNGGSYADTFRFAVSNTGSDTINGFQTDIDRFDLTGGTFSERVEDEGNTLLTHAGGTITVTGVTGLTLAQWNARVLPSSGSDASDEPGPIGSLAGGWHDSFAVAPGIIPGFGAPLPDLWLSLSDYF